MTQAMTIETPTAGPNRTIWAWFAALMGWTILLSFYCLSGGAEFEPTDCWVAQTAREMQQAGNWMVPRFSGETRLQKSPGAYWAVMLTSVIRGKPVDEISARIPNAVAAVLLAATIFWLARAVAGERAAIYAGFATSASIMTLYWSHRGASDLGLAAMMSLSMACLWAGCNEESNPRRRHVLWMVGYFAAGLAMLYKMPMPLACVGFPAFLYVVLRKRWRVLLDPWHLVGLALFMLPWLPWALGVVLTEPTAIPKWRVEFLDRFTGNLPNVEAQKKFVFYFLYLIPTFFYPLPFSLSVIPAFVRGFRARENVNRDGVAFMLIWFFGHLFFFTAATGKELRYFLPALPPLFVLLGMELAAVFDPKRATSPKLDRLAAIGVWTLLPAALAAGLFGIRKFITREAVFTWHDVWPPYVVTGAIFWVGASLAAWLYLRRHRNASFAALVGTMWLTWLWAWPKLMPVLASQAPFLNFAEQLHEKIPADLRPYLRNIGSQDARIIWYSDVRVPRIIDQLELLKMQGGRRSLETETRLVAEEMVTQLSGEKPALLLASRVDYMRFLIEAPPEMAQRGKPFPKTYLWLQTGIGKRPDRHFVVFGNKPPPWPEPSLNPPPGETFRRAMEKLSPTTTQAAK